MMSKKTIMLIVQLAIFGIAGVIIAIMGLVIMRSSIGAGVFVSMIIAILLIIAGVVLTIINSRVQWKE
jgi:uncharacterized membrane protein HdeD (DUF308 family)